MYSLSISCTYNLSTLRHSGDSWPWREWRLLPKATCKSRERGLTLLTFYVDFDSYILVAFLKEPFNHYSVSNFFPPWPQHHSHSTQYAVPQFPRGTQSQVSWKFGRIKYKYLTRALKSIPLGLGKFRTLYLSNSPWMARASLRLCHETF